MSQKVTIVGAGFSGLTLAWLLTKKNIKVAIYEKSDRPGGLIQTVPFRGLPVETAANGFLWTPRLQELFDDLQVPMIGTKPESKARFFWREFPKRWPLSFFETLGFAARILPKFLFFRQKLKPLPTESVQEWAEKHLGPAAAEFIVGTALQGIYAGDPRKMSADLILGRFFKPRKKSPRRGTVSPREGMSQLMQALDAKLTSAGVEIHYNFAVDLKDISGPVVLATSAPAAAELLAEVEPQASKLLSQVDMLPLIKSTVTFTNLEKPIKGFGVLVPARYACQTLGILSNTFIFENRGSEYNETWILGGAHHRSVTDQENSEIQRVITQERRALLQDSACLKDCHITRWPQALPHYTLEHAKILEGLKTLKSVRLTGNYLGSIGLSQILEHNATLAEELSHV